ncbi:hypothetical protein TI03_02965, partial [Achromatium sp. WMS1]
ILGFCFLLPCSIYGAAWAPIADNVTSESLAAQRREIEALKQLFARIDSRIEQIAKIQRNVESLINNRDATSACTAVDMLRSTEEELNAQINQTTNDTDKIALEEELAKYRAILTEAEVLTSKLGCR